MSHSKDSRSGLAMSFLGPADASGSSHAAPSSSFRNGSHRSPDASRAPHSSSSSRPSRAFGNAFGDEEDEEHTEYNGDRSSQRNGRGARREELTGYSRSGAEKARRSPSPQGPRVIPLVGGSDWRGDRKRRLGLENLQGFGSLTSMRAGAQEGKAVPPPRDSELHRSAGEGLEKIGDEKQKVGLQVRGKSRREQEEEEELRKLVQSAAEDKTPPLDQAAPSPPVRMTEDERARRALLSGQGSALPSLNADRTIAMHNPSSAGSAPFSEEQAFKYDADSRPDAPSLDDYAATPVEEFGKALLRGMGWREGMGAGKGGVGPNAPPEVKKRSALLGLGAKERPAAAATGGSAVKRDFKVKKPDAREYKPLVRREAMQQEEREHSRSGSSGRREGESRGSKRSHSPAERSKRWDEEDKADRRRDTTRENHRDAGDGHRDRDRDRDGSKREHRDYRRHHDRDRSGRDERGSRDDERRYDERRRERYRDRSP